MMAAGLLAWTAACGGASQDATQGNGQGAALTGATSVPGTPPAGYEGSALQKQAAATALATTPLAPIVTESGFISLSLDGVGTNGSSGIVQVNKPAGATVKAAYLAAASTGFSNYSIPNGGVKIDGQSVNWGRSIQSGISSYNHWADVTSLVASKINSAPAGRVNFTVTETQSYSVDGEILAVVFNNPAATTVNTVILLFGAQSTGGDTFRIGLAEPINKADPNLGLDLSLGISFGYQDGSSSERQVSIIDVNGSRLTSQAGGQDDGASEDGALITVGGLDDSNANPNPNAGGPGFRGDDELYDLRPFVANGATQITIATRNPSNDDNIFFGALSLTSAAAIIGEGIVLGPTTSTGPVGSSHTVTATLQDDNGNPLLNRTVTFRVRTGPNANVTGTAVTNAQGKATFTYTGNGGVGRDDIQASFVRSNGQTATSNSAFRDWTAANRPPTASCGNLVLEADLTCGATGSINNGSSDPDGDQFNCTQSPAGPYGPGTTTVTLTCTDSKGASASCSATVQVVDNTGPSIVCPSNKVAECVDNAAFVDAGLATARDNCGEANVSSPPPASYPLGVTPVVHTATDSSYNTASCTSLVTVQDTQAPAIVLRGEGTIALECRAAFTDPGAVSNDVCVGGASTITTAGSVNTGAPGTYALTYTATDPSGNASSVSRAVIVEDTQAPTITLNGGAYIDVECNGDFEDPGAVANDACQGALPVTISGGIDSTQSGTYVITYSAADSAGNAVSVTRNVTVGPCETCIEINLSDYNLFLLGDYNGGHDVVGKVAAGGNITMDNFAVGSGLAASDTANVLVAGGNLSLNRGAVFGDARYGGSFSTNPSVIFPRGGAAQGTPIDFAAKAAELQALSAQLASLPVNGTTTKYNWGGIYLKGTDASVNVVSVQASDFNGAKLLDINAPAGSLMVVNIYGASATFGGFGTQFSGGVNQTGVVYNFVGTTSISAQGFGFWGTVLAPSADVTFHNGSWDGGFYAKSFTGNAEGHINPLGDHSICPPTSDYNY
ncbi:choice-of-anchor A family protein [Hyalangium gracile]|uniref:choice-of-anchor A family protein n=1 Tax=Hyalangium gracile TaxID=394092 RepID=UPI001CCB017A|nr:choice-of-anchor A family protein [Hyalangium gracile]